MTSIRGQPILPPMRPPSMSLPFATMAVALVLTLPAQAMDIETYDKQLKLPANSLGQIRLSSYLLGIGEGLRLANEALRSRGETGLFCAPDAAPLFAVDYKKLIDGVLAGSRAALVGQGSSIEQILLKALQDAHPCGLQAPAAVGP
jgi:hypothetical protein